MTKNKEIILMENGDAVLRTTTEQPINLVDRILEPMSESVTRVIQSAFEIDGQPAAILAGKEVFGVVLLDHLLLNCQWKVSGNKILPVFSRPGEVMSDCPSLKLRWTRPTGMLLTFVCRIYGGLETRPEDSCYLLAYNQEGNCHYPPLPNIFEDGALCMGSFNGKSTSLKGALELAYQQLQNSQWNSDLLNVNQEECQHLFCLTKTQDEEGRDVFTPTPVSSWESYCPKCETSVVSIVRQMIKSHAPIS